MYLEKINSPEDVKSLTIPELRELACEIRNLIIETVIENGGHLASNLGVVEITLALLYVFDFDRDKIIFDVGHQCYAYKILTGRFDRFKSLRKTDGLSGFPKREESVYDFFNTGHSGTSLSAGAGMARARDLNHEKYDVISLIGDASLTNGMCFEALNDIGNNPSKQIVVLNDNDMSISRNVGAVSSSLTKLRENTEYKQFKKAAVNFLEKIDREDKSNYFKLKKIKDSVKYAFMDGVLFEEFGLKYLGPIDGHDLVELINYFRIAKEEENSIIVHVITVKGKGCKEARKDPERFHGVKPLFSEKQNVSYPDTLGNTLRRMMFANPKIAAVCAAMSENTGLSAVSDMPAYFDVGIAEEHAVTMSAGLAASGYKPFVAIYSSFLQRAFDQIIHDVALQNLPVCFCVDRAGLVGEDGETHQGILDLSFLSLIPNLTVLSPMNTAEFTGMLEWSAESDGPVAIRYPRGSFASGYKSDLNVLRWQILEKGAGDVVVIATGAVMVSECEKALKSMRKSGFSPQFVNARCIKPLDRDYLVTLEGKLVFVFEDNIERGGLGQSIVSYCAEKEIDAVFRLKNLGDEFVPHGDVRELMRRKGIDAGGIEEFIKKFL